MKEVVREMRAFRVARVVIEPDLMVAVRGGTARAAAVPTSSFRTPASRRRGPADL